MQASTPMNETRLPRAVQIRSAALAEKYRTREPGASTADPNASPAQPNAQGTAPTAEPGATPSAAPSPQPPIQNTDPRESDPAYWKQRFSVTSGMLTREREERVAGETALRQQITELQQQIHTLQTQAPPAPVALDQFLTAEQIETLGEEEAKAVASAAAKAAADAATRALDARLKPIEDAQARAKADDARAKQQAFFDKLAELVPDYAEIDKSEDWLAWLAQEDDVVGIERQQILNTYSGRYDAVKVAKMLQTYKALNQPPAPPIAPRASGASPNGDIPQPDTSALTPPSTAEVKDFYKRAALGKVSNEERVKFEARLKLRAGR